MSISVNIEKRYVSSKKGVSASSVITRTTSTSFGGGDAAWHFERGEKTLEAGDNRTVTITFNKPFPSGSVPIGLGDVKVYKWIADGSDFIKQDVLYKFPVNLSPHTQFIVKIDDSEDVDGVVIYYFFS